MRARGAKVTDIVVLVVAADDGVMPQTKEAIDHAKAANVSIVVAINKIDKAEAQPERVKRQLADNGLLPADWGGDTEFVEVSAKQKTGIDKLLETLLALAELRELKANPDAPATGTVLESRVDKGRGPVATILIQNGTLNPGDFFICGAVFGKVRAMFDDRGRPAKDAPPSTPIEVLGLQGIPDAGDNFQVTDEAKARHIVEYRQGKQRDAAMARTSGARITLDQLHEQMKSGDVKELGIVIKADVQGSVEVLSEMLPKLSTDQVKLKIIGSGVGAVTENDVLLASASGAIIIAFGIRPDRKAVDLAQQETRRHPNPHPSFMKFPTNLKKPWKACSSRSSRRRTSAARKCATPSASKARARWPVAMWSKACSSATRKFASCAIAPSSTPPSSVRSSASKTTPARCAPALNAARASPISTT